MTTAIESKQDATKQSQKEQLETFSCMLDIGEAMLATGADVDTVEDILVKMGLWRLQDGCIGDHRTHHRHRNDARSQRTYIEQAHP